MGRDRNPQPAERPRPPPRSHRTVEAKKAWNRSRSEARQGWRDDEREVWEDRRENRRESREDRHEDRQDAREDRREENAQTPQRAEVGTPRKDEERQRGARHRSKKKRGADTRIPANRADHDDGS